MAINSNNRRPSGTDVDMTPVPVGVRFQNDIVQSSRLAVGVDAGVETGLAIWDHVLRRFVTIQTTKIHRAWDLLRAIKPRVDIVVVEDIRNLKRRGGLDPKRIQGAGSVKRDCTAWEDFLIDEGFPALMRPIGRNSVRKLNREQFNMITGWSHPTSSHGRDAAMLVLDWRPLPTPFITQNKPNN